MHFRFRTSAIINFVYVLSLLRLPCASIISALLLLKVTTTVTTNFQPFLKTCLQCIIGER